MRRLPGQAAAFFARFLSGPAAGMLGQVLHRLGLVVLTLAVVVALLLAGLAWRLSRGPLDVTWLMGRIEAMAGLDTGPTRLAVRGAALAWDGFRQGVDNPVELQFTGVTLTNALGQRQIEIPRADLSVSLGSLLLGRVVPRALELDGARLTLVRRDDGSWNLDLGSLRDASEPSADAAEAEATPLKDLLAQLAHPATGDLGQADHAHGSGVLSQLRTIAVRDATVTIVDRRLGATWRAPRADMSLTRRQAGGVDGRAVLNLALGDQTATLSLTAAQVTGGHETQVHATLTPVAPAALARAAPGLSAIAALDAPVAVQADALLGPSLEFVSGRLGVRVGAGLAASGTARVPIERAEIVVAGTAEQVKIETARLDLPGRGGGAPARLVATGQMSRADGRTTLSGTVSVDQVAFADLPALWPEGLANGARSWVTQNIPTGLARNAKVSVALAGNADLASLALTSVSGVLDGEDLTVHWLRPVPPLEKGQAQLRILDPDTIEITVAAARQKGGARGGYLTVRNGKVRIANLSRLQETLTIQADVTGSLANAIGLLREPRLNILDRQPIEFRDPAGDVSVNLSVQLPLVADLKAEQVATRAGVRITQGHLSAFVAGRDVDQADLDLEVTNDGMTVKGRGLLANIASQVDGMLDFREGPPTQVLRRIAVTARPGAGQLSAAGIDSLDMLLGEVALSAVYTERRNGEGEITVDADFTPSVLVASPIGWRKPSGVAARGTARVVLSKGRIRAIERIAIDGDALTLRGTIDYTDGRLSAVRIERGALGRTEVRGTVRLPVDGPVAIDLSGPTLDIVPRVMESQSSGDRTRGDAQPGVAWSLESRFDRVFLAGGQSATGVVARGHYTGRIYGMLSVSGRMAGNAPFSLDISGNQGRRRLAVTASDAGSLLRGLHIVRPMEGGNLSIDGWFDDSRPTRPLIGTARIEDFRVRGSVGLAKLLQAMTLYGLVDVLSGPGLGFTRLIAPFQLDEDTLVLNDARAFSPSLGMTAKGRLELDAERADIEGTIVPAYFFNSMLGNIPLVGRLFSPEKGGGVFAARYTVTGKLDDPAVFVNPLSALTPGFLREIFDIF